MINSSFVKRKIIFSNKELHYLLKCSLVNIDKIVETPGTLVFTSSFGCPSAIPAWRYLFAGFWLADKHGCRQVQLRCGRAPGFWIHLADHGNFPAAACRPTRLLIFCSFFSLQIYCRSIARHFVPKNTYILDYNPEKIKNPLFLLNTGKMQ